MGDMETNEKMENMEIREEFNIPTVKGKLEYYKYKKYISCESIMSFSYLNNEADIDKSLGNIN